MIGISMERKPVIIGGRAHRGEDLEPNEQPPRGRHPKEERIDDGYPAVQDGGRVGAQEEIVEQENGVPGAVREEEVLANGVNDQRIMQLRAQQFALQPPPWAQPLQGDFAAFFNMFYHQWQHRYHHGEPPRRGMRFEASDDEVIDVEEEAENEEQEKRIERNARKIAKLERALAEYDQEEQIKQLQKRYDEMRAARAQAPSPSAAKETPRRRGRPRACRIASSASPSAAKETPRGRVRPPSARIASLASSSKAKETPRGRGRPKKRK